MEGPYKVMVKYWISLWEISSLNYLWLGLRLDKIPTYFRIDCDIAATAVWLAFPARLYPIRYRLGTFPALLHSVRRTWQADRSGLIVSCYHFSILSTQILFYIHVAPPKALAHYNWNYKKKAVIVHTHYNLISQLQWFFQQFYLRQRFSRHFIFWKIVEKYFVECEGL